MAIKKPYKPQAIPVPKAANMNTMSRGLRKAVRNWMTVKAPNMPKPEATLSPMACKTMVAIKALRIKDWIKLVVRKVLRVVMLYVKAIKADNKNDNKKVNKIISKVGFSIFE